jgi:hypothetical protein
MSPPAARVVRRFQDERQGWLTGGEVVVMVDALRDEPRIRGGLSRRLGAVLGGRPPVTAVVVGLAGVGAFVASLLSDWLRVTLEPVPQAGISSGTYVYDLTITSFASVYPIGMLGLLTMLGLAFPRPDVARRLRLGAVILGVGLVAVLVAIVDDMRDMMRENLLGRSLYFYEDDLPEILRQLLDSQTTAPLPGQMLAFGAVALLVAAVWLAGGPARSAPGAAVAASPGNAAADEPSADQPATAPVSPADAPPASEATPAGPLGGPLGRPAPADGPARAGYVDGLTVVSSDVIDLGVRPTSCAIDREPVRLGRALRRLPRRGRQRCESMLARPGRPP